MKITMLQFVAANLSYKWMIAFPVLLSFVAYRSFEFRSARSFPASNVARCQDVFNRSSNLSNFDVQASLALLNSLPVTDPHAPAGYNRKRLFRGWEYVDGCSTRRILLRRHSMNCGVDVDIEAALGVDGGLGEAPDLESDHWSSREASIDVDDALPSQRHRQHRKGRGCRMPTGPWWSPYDGCRSENADDFQIDHLVALREVWVSGGHAWSSAQWSRYANDYQTPGLLQVVSGTSNSDKGHSDPAVWLPPYTPSICRYVIDWVNVKSAYGLSVDAAEAAAIRSVLDGPACHNQLQLHTSTTRTGEG